MMEKFFFTLFLVNVNETFMQLIPRHRAHVDELLEHEIIETYAVNLDRSKAWIVVNAATREEAVAVIESFIIRDYFTYQVDQLFIYENALGLMPKMVLN